MPSRPRVLTIPASQPHLRTLATAILDGRVVPGWPDAGDPLSLAAGTILLPNRRACRAMRDVFAEIAGDRAILLPRIAPIGDVDEDEWAFADPSPLDVLGLDAIAPAMPALDRRLTLAGLVRQWAASVDRAVMKLGERDPLVVSTSTGDALSLAADLMRLMDQAETERVPWTGLDAIVDSHLDEFWRMTRAFLAIATEHWPAHLKAIGQEEPAVRRDRLIAAETIRLAALPGPIIAAGSTGSIPATRELLATVAQHPRGALILPGLDQHLDNEAWEAIGAGGAAATHAHPQFGLKRLIGHLGIARGEVEAIAPPALPEREALLSEAMRPAATTDRWAERPREDVEPSLEGLAVIEAANERDEALAIAVLLREVAEDPERSAALVTPDRAIAGRVVAELSRWNVAVDDSGGRPLAATSAGAVARLVAALALDDPAPADLLALLSQPAARFGLAEDEKAAAIAAIELKALRGLRPPGGLAGYAATLARATVAKEPRLHDPASRVNAAALTAGRALMDRLIAALAPLADLRGSPAPMLADLAAAHLAAIGNLGLDAETLGLGETVALLESAMRGPATTFAVPPDDYPSAFDALTATEIVRIAADPGARIRVLGLPEARLLDADCVVLAGLVEGSWPGEPKLDPWLNRAMRASFGIDPPERRIGLAAHDFCQLLGNPRVIMTRAAKAGGVPTVPSRWLQRLAAVTGPEAWAGLVARGAAWLALAGEFEKAGEARPAPRPEPKPPVALRPARLSVTEIETLQRDPYAVYARHVLHLAPLEPLDQTPGAAERGTLIHGVLDAFAREVSAAGAPVDPVARLLDLGRAHFAPFWDDPSVRAVWWPRFVRIARWFAAADAERRLAFPTVHAEDFGRIDWETVAARTFTLVTKADRIDVSADGKAEIVDYKTGSVPGDREVMVGLNPQLPLEAAVLMNGGFRAIPADLLVDGFLYVKLGGRDPAGEFKPVKLDRPAAQIAAETLANLKALIDAYENPAQSYKSWTMPKYVGGRSNDYAHLARVKEWSAAGGGE
jgi:ATP-dependent helicase/nuclease subunit B